MMNVLWIIAETYCLIDFESVKIVNKICVTANVIKKKKKENEKNVYLFLIVSLLNSMLIFAQDY